MAALTDDARAMRLRSARTREDSRSLRLQLHGSREQVASVLAGAREACARVEERRAAGVPTAWSALRWELPGAQLDDVLTIV